MSQHQFIFRPGTWVGEGSVSFSTAQERLKFYTRWSIKEAGNGLIFAQQEVQMPGSHDGVWNTLIFSHVNHSKFQVELKNELMGSTQGKGLIDAKTIAWEFRGHEHFEGFEVYELQEDGDYSVHAEYASSEQYRTIIDGRIWKK